MVSRRQKIRQVTGNLTGERALPESVAIRIVGSEFAVAAVGILREASQWLDQRNLRGWAPSELQDAVFAVRADAGELVLGFVAGQPVACMLLQCTDELYWPEAARGTALYVHKLAVKRSSAGNHWSARLIRWAEDHARRRGISHLRLDTWADSPLRALYGSYGFRAVDRVPILVQGRAMTRMQCTVVGRSCDEVSKSPHRLESLRSLQLRRAEGVGGEGFQPAR
jgi:GNAT superfamily N-acetyltransferase